MAGGGLLSSVRLSVSVYRLSVSVSVNIGSSFNFSVILIDWLLFMLII